MLVIEPRQLENRWKFCARDGVPLIGRGNITRDKVASGYFFGSLLVDSAYSRFSLTTRLPTRGRPTRCLRQAYLSTSATTIAASTGHNEALGGQPGLQDCCCCFLCLQECGTSETLIGTGDRLQECATPPLFFQVSQSGESEILQLRLPDSSVRSS